ncbi:MAG: thioredoxin domain-containing protein, partial [Oscillospiraceae bacterium]|nr:thioredoxin domain-containing protein [Oscillospiraceae bacterium]
MSNHLKNETSPYLLQHAENPVDWYPWGEETFSRAAAEDKPVFLSVGYSTCHWCHVMAHESFENPGIAGILNRHFISVKVDREERPDIDSVYMAVCQALTGSGGWPMSVFLTPEKKPFFAGTYFAPQVFASLLERISSLWQENRTGLLESADSVTEQIRLSDGQDEPCEDADLIGQAMQTFRRSFDPKYGGFGGAPKFPTPHSLLFLLLYGSLHSDAGALEMAEKTLTQMRLGGIFDQIGGGFSRYSTDRQYLVPHYEKMLYDNALLITAYAAAYHLTQNRLYLQTAEQTAQYVLREMTSPEGGFYSAQDADSEGEEGKFYTFSLSEILDVLGEEQGSRFAECYNVTAQGNFEGKNIPNLLQTGHIPEEFADALQTLYDYRKARTALHLDDKILLSWNALMIAALCALYRVSG